MGQRANLLIVENGEYQLYYTHWGANRLPNDLFWGPDFAIEFIRKQRAVDQKDWLNSKWAEGGAIVDITNKTLLFYGGEDLLFDVPLRWLFLDLFRCVWDGWEVNWAQEGIVSIAEYVGYPRSKVIVESGLNLGPLPLTRITTKQFGGIYTLGSVRVENQQLWLFPMGDYPDEYLKVGPKLLDGETIRTGYESLDLIRWQDDDPENFLDVAFPQAGFHIDMAEQTIGVWSADDIPDIQQIVQRKWPTWQVTWWEDDYRRHFDLLGSVLRYPERSNELLLERIKDLLLFDYGGSPIDRLLDLSKQAPASGAALFIANPNALHFKPQSLNRETKEEILNNAIEKWTTG